MNPPKQVGVLPEPFGFLLDPLARDEGMHQARDPNTRSKKHRFKRQIVHHALCRASPKQLFNAVGSTDYLVEPF